MVPVRPWASACPMARAGRSWKHLRRSANSLASRPARRVGSAEQRAGPLFGQVTAGLGHKSSKRARARFARWRKQTMIAMAQHKPRVCKWEDIDDGKRFGISLTCCTAGCRLSLSLSLALVGVYLCPKLVKAAFVCVT